MKQTKYRMGVDLGGTKTEVILLNPYNKETYRKRIKTPASSGYESILRSLLELISEVILNIPDGNDYTIGVGIPGSINPETGLVQNANTTCLIGKPLQQDIEKFLGRKTCIENDANCFTLAESIEGAAKDFNFVFGVIMGTGCGGGICIDRAVRKGSHSISGEWGHVSIDPAGAECYCGNRGCIETKISGGGVEAAYLKKYGEKLTMQEILEGYRKGEPSCCTSFEEFLEDFGRSIGGLISILDPDAVVIGGGLSNIKELYTEGYKRIKKYVFHSDIKTPVLKNRLGDSAGVFGAAWIGK
jgi:fructokinase